MTYILFIFGLILVVLGTVRMSTDFKKNNRKNNFIQLLLTGHIQALDNFFQEY